MQQRFEDCFVRGFKGEPCSLSETIEVMTKCAAKLCDPTKNFDEQMFWKLYDFDFCDEIVEAMKSIGYRFRPALFHLKPSFRMSLGFQERKPMEVEMTGDRLLFEEYGVVVIFVFPEVIPLESPFTGVRFGKGPPTYSMMGELDKEKDRGMMLTRATSRLMEWKINQLDAKMERQMDALNTKVDHLRDLVQDALFSALAARNRDNVRSADLANDNE